MNEAAGIDCTGTISVIIDPDEFDRRRHKKPTLLKSVQPIRRRVKEKGLSKWILLFVWTDSF